MNNGGKWPGRGRSLNHQNVNSNLSLNPSNESSSFLHPAQQHNRRPGSSQEMSIDAVSTSTICFPARIGLPPKCINCVAHDCERSHLRDYICKLTRSQASLSAETAELQTKLFLSHEELYSCHTKIQILEECLEKCTHYKEEIKSQVQSQLTLENKEPPSAQELSNVNSQISQQVTPNESEALADNLKYRCSEEWLTKHDHPNKDSSDQHGVSEESRGWSGSSQESRPSGSSQEGSTSSAWSNRDIRPKRNSFGQQSRHANGSGSSHKEINGSDKTSEFLYSNHSAGESSENKQSVGISSNAVKEIKCDLFEMGADYALAHCVGSDFLMSSGVAVNFRKKYKSTAELLDQNKNPGQVAFISPAGQYIYYLVTKLASNGKPTWEDFEKSVIEWRNLCVNHKVKKVAIPKIGCGRDQLDWGKVKNLLNEQFAGTGIEIIVCVIDHEIVPDTKWNVKLCHSQESLSLLDPRDCALVFIASKDREINEPIKKLATKAGFTSDYSRQPLTLGSLYTYSNKAIGVNVYGLVVKERHSDPISFCMVHKCLQDLKRAMRRENFAYLGFEAFDDPQFAIATRKMWTVITEVFYIERIEVYFCWPPNVSEKCWEERRS